MIKNEDKNINIEFVAEQWVRLAFAHIQLKKLQYMATNESEDKEKDE
jgi:hypothetical protein